MINSIHITINDIPTITLRQGWMYVDLKEVIWTDDQLRTELDEKRRQKKDLFPYLFFWQQSSTIISVKDIIIRDANK